MKQLPNILAFRNSIDRSERGPVIVRPSMVWMWSHLLNPGGARYQTALAMKTLKAISVIQFPFSLNEVKRRVRHLLILWRKIPLMARGKSGSEVLQHTKPSLVNSFLCQNVLPLQHGYGKKGFHPLRRLRRLYPHTNNRSTFYTTKYQWCIIHDAACSTLKQESVLW